MGLKSELTADIEEALLSDLSDATHSGTLLKEDAVGEIDPLNGYSATSTSYPYTLGVASNYSQAITDGVNVKQGDKKLFILQRNIQATPAAGDIVLMNEGKNSYEVVAAGSDPANVGYTLQLRECSA